MDPSGKVAVVTGAAGGIGAALTRRLLEAGARVVMVDLDADATTAALGSPTDDALAVGADAADEADLRRVLAVAEEAFGVVDLYAANAGVLRGVGLEATDEDWRVSLEVNLMAHVRAARLLVPGWVERGAGHFVATASAAGLVTQLGVPTYAASKHAAVGFAEWLAVTYGGHGVGVTCLCPMAVDTAMLRAGEASGDPAARAATRSVTASGAVLSPLDVADQVLEAVRDGRFLVLPHPEVATFVRRKAADHDAWVRGMQRFGESLHAEA
jgi:NAD(P)-dependent dehydrogenase (short-subunit alcohol dehydrogenase family)